MRPVEIPRARRLARENGHDAPRQKEEQREDEVVVVEADPVHMLHLLSEEIRDRRRQRLGERREHTGATDEPEHVVASENIN